MSSDWIRSDTAKMIVGQMGERRPAWLWTPDGETPLWRNPAARLFMAKHKKHKTRLAKEAVPIKGQVRRLIRLGSFGLPSLARVRFLVGQKPVSATCTCTPLLLENGELGLLIVGVDEIEKSLFRDLDLPDRQASSLFGDNREHLFFDVKGRVFSGSERALQEWSDRKFKPGKKWRIVLEPGKYEFGLALRKAGSSKVGSETKTRPRSTKAPDKVEQEVLVAATSSETGKHHSEKTEQKGSARRPLSGLLDQLANDSNLLEPLDPDTDDSGYGESSGDTEAPEKMDLGKAEPTDTPLQMTSQWRVTGRGFSADTDHTLASRLTSVVRTDRNEHVEQNETGGAITTPDQSVEPDVDRVARYNFDELSRILSDRVAKENGTTGVGIPASKRATRTGKGKQEGLPDKTVKLSEELLVLNRLPIGILIFRDQSILFANRALADIMGSPSISRLREGGLDAIFPQVDDEGTALGPVAHLLNLNGKEVPVTARLQTIVWQGRSALMLSAQRNSSSSADGEINIRAFVRAQATAQNEGYFEADRNGTITQVSELMEQLLGQARNDLIDQTLEYLTGKEAQPKLRDFLMKPAKFAETARPNIRLPAAGPQLEINLYTQGRAGLVTGYFGTISANSTAQKTGSNSESQTDTQLLGRLSRGIRRPLNSIIGFSEMVQSETFGKQENQRYAEYARDIKNAGNEISQLVDEIDEYVRLESEENIPQAFDFDLGDLLDECLRLVRRQAGHRQVFVRSAISQDIRSVSADRATMRQAILNLLASAIDQSQTGGKVVLSAQTEADGSIGIHVRNSDTHSEAPGDRFVVFREGDKKRAETLVPLKSSMGLTLTRSLLAVNECSLSIDPSASTGTLMTLLIPAERISQKG